MPVSPSLSDVPFALGANLPWIRYGGDFGANAWHPAGGLAARGIPDDLTATLAALSQSGSTYLRWFLLCDGRSGIEFAPGGLPTGLDPYICEDIDAALTLAERTGQRLVLSLLDFLWCRRAAVVTGVQIGGRRRVLATTAGQDALLSRVIAPLLARYGHHPAIAAWEVINEPEWVTFGVGTLNPFTSVSRRAMRRFIAETAALVHSRATQPVTVGSAHVRWRSLVEGLGLDFYQVHWYDRLDRRVPLGTAVCDFCLDKPVVLGEFPTRGSARSSAEILALARDCGYAGAWPWSLRADDGASDAASALQALAAEGLRPVASPDRASGAR